MSHGTPLDDLAYVAEVLSRGTGQLEALAYWIGFQIVAFGLLKLFEWAFASGPGGSKNTWLEYGCFMLMVGPFVYVAIIPWLSIACCLGFWAYRWTVVWAAWRLLYFPLGWSASFDIFMAQSCVAFVFLGCAAWFLYRVYFIWEEYWVFPGHYKTWQYVVTTMCLLFVHGFLYVYPLESAGRDGPFRASIEAGVYTKATCTFALLLILAILAVDRDWVPQPSSPRQARLGAFVALQVVAVAHCAPFCAAYPLLAVLFASIVPVFAS